VPARREAHDADAVGIDVPFLGVGTHRAKGALCVEKWYCGSTFREPVLQHDPCDAMLVEPLGDVVPLRVNHQAAIPAARAKHHRRPIGLSGGR